MQLIIKQYLSLLKESRELDSLLPDLLLAMGIEPVTRAQVGPRQFGVDVTAVGKDDEGRKTFFIFTIKQGDLGRTDWDGADPQKVRPSLEEIKDVFIPTHIENKHKSLPIKVIVCTGGEKKQEIAMNWSQYVNQNQVEGKLEYEFWGGDKLTPLIEKNLFNEAILPLELQSKLRKTLALISDPDYDLSDYHSILDEIFLKKDYGDIKKPSVVKKIRKALSTVSLCQNIVYYWAKNEGNIKPAIYCSERTVLYAWDFLRRNEFYANKKIAPQFHDMYFTLYRVYSDYFNKVQNHCYVKNGFCGYGRHHIQENLNIFEHLGLVSTTGLLCVYQGITEKNESLFENARAISDALKNFVNNHLATKAPCYDGHIIDISAAIHLISVLDDGDFVDKWVTEMVNNIAFSYQNMGGLFPIHSDSFDDLVALNISGTLKRETLFEMSTLLPILAQWCIALKLDETYAVILAVVEQFFPECTLQIWYPTDETDEQLYIGHAGGTGAVDAPLELTEDIEEMRHRIRQVQKNTIEPDKISSIENGMSILPILASRHYRTPILPMYWQSRILGSMLTEAERPSDQTSDKTQVR